MQATRPVNSLVSGDGSLLRRECLLNCQVSCLLSLSLFEVGLVGRLSERVFLVENFGLTLVEACLGLRLRVR